VLSDLDIVEREVPVTEDKPVKSKKIRISFLALLKLLTFFCGIHLLTSWNEDIAPKTTRSMTQKATQIPRNLQIIKF